MCLERCPTGSQLACTWRHLQLLLLLLPLVLLLHSQSLP
jgi:hypothetical protein